MESNSEFSCVAIIPAAGTGTRLREVTADKPKSLLKLQTPFGERSLLAITVHKLLDSALFSGLIVACPQEHLVQMKEEFDSHLPIEFIVGGYTRQKSVHKALECLTVKEVTHVAIHDAARPFVSLEALTEVVKAGVQTGAAILVERVTSTIKKISAQSEVLETLPRQEMTLAQTPQVFDYELILNAHRQGAQAGFVATDDAQLVERLGIRPVAVVNHSLNPKITEPSDLELARMLANR